jgi:hypothetical protein
MDGSVGHRPSRDSDRRYHTIPNRARFCFAVSTLAHDFGSGSVFSLGVRAERSIPVACLCEAVRRDQYPKSQAFHTDAANMESPLCPRYVILADIGSVSRYRSTYR